MDPVDEAARDVFQFQRFWNAAFQTPRFWNAAASINAEPGRAESRGPTPPALSNIEAGGGGPKVRALKTL